MMTFLLTLGLTFLVILLCIVGLSIGKLLTGRNKLHAKRCGNPEKDEKKSCDVCGNKRCTKKR